MMTRRWMSFASIVAVVMGVFSRPATAVDYVRIPQDPTGGGYQAFPDITRLQDGRLMCVFYNGYQHVSLPNAQWPNGGRIDYSISTNEGYTWSTPQVLYDGPYDDRDPSITQLPSGQLVLNFFSMTAASTDLGERMITSNDAGKTWSAVQNLYPNPTYDASSPIRQLSDGRLIMGLYYETGSNASNGTAYGAVGISDNGGQTWSQPVIIPNGGNYIDAETDVIQLKNGSLYAAERTDFNSMYFSISVDNGNSWSVSQPLGWNGHCPYLHRAPDGIILLGYRDYTGGVTACVTALTNVRPGAVRWWSIRWAAPTRRS